MRISGRSDSPYDEPLLTVILLTHNDPSGAQRAARALASQKIDGTEIIAIDDASNDGTAAVLQSVIGNIPEVRILKLEKNLGIAKARNLGVRLASGRHVLFIDGDDELREGALEAFARSLEDDTDIVVSRAIAITDARFHATRIVDGLATRTYESGHDAFRRIVNGSLHGFLWNKAIRRELLLRHPFPPLSSQSDLAALSVLTPEAKEVLYIPDVTYSYYVHAGSATNSSSHKSENIEQCTQIIINTARRHRIYSSNAAEIVSLQQRTRLQIVNTSLRLGSPPPPGPSSSGKARASQMNRHAFGIAWKSDTRTAAASWILLKSPALYAAAYKTYRATCIRHTPASTVPPSEPDRSSGRVKTPPFRRPMIVRMRRGLRRVMLGALALTCSGLYSLRNASSRTRVVDPLSRIDLSMATYGPRIPTVHLALESIAAGHVRPHRMILWIADSDFRLTSGLRRLMRRGLEVFPVSSTLGPHAKWFPYTQQWDGLNSMVTADDDLFYPSNWLSTLQAAQNAASIVAHRTHRIAIRNGAIQPYRSWPIGFDTAPSPLNFPTGAGGCLYPPAALRILAAKAAGGSFLKTCPRQDDIWLHSTLIEAGFFARQPTDRPFALRGIPGTGEVALLNGNLFGGENDAAVARAYSADALRLLVDSAKCW